MRTYFLRVASFTIAQALLSTAVAALVGLVMAFFVAKRRFFCRRFLLSLSALPLCLPALIMALGYVTLFGRSGGVNGLLRALFGANAPQLSFLYTAAGIVIAQGFFNFPLVMATVQESWSRLPTAEADSARLLGAGEGRVFLTVTLYQLATAIVSACIPVFLFCFFSFLLVMLFGGVGCATLEVEIYRSMRNDAPRAYLLAGIETALALAVVGCYSWFEKKSLTGAVSRGARGLLPQACERLPLQNARERLIFGASALLVLLFFLLPLAGIIGNAFGFSVSSNGRAGGDGAAAGRLVVQGISVSLVHVRRLFASTNFLLALKGTCASATATALFCAVLAFCYAVCLHAHPIFGSRLVARLIPLVPMAISSVVLASVLIRLVSRGTVLLLVCAQTALYWPFAFRQVYAEISKIPQETVGAARLLARSPFQTLLHIYIPCGARGVIRAAGFCFAMSAGDTTLPLVMGIHGFHSLALFTYRLAGSYRFSEACAAGMLLALLCALVFGGAERLKNGARSA